MRSLTFGSIFMIGLVVVAGGMWAFLATNYFALEGYLGHTTPNTAELAWRFIQGQPLFVPYEQGGVLLTAYGPWLFVVHAAVLSLFPASLSLVKVAPFAATALSIVVLGLALGKRYGVQKAAFGLFVYMAALLMAGIVPFWNRPEPFLLLLVALGVWASAAQARKTESHAQNHQSGIWVPTFALAVLVGIAVNFKVTAFVYFLPLAVGYFSRQWYWRWPLMGAVAVGVFLLAFLLPGLSLTAYLANVFGVAGERGIDPGLLKQGVKYALTFLSPLLVVAAAFAAGRLRDAKAPGDLLYAGAFVVAVVLVLYPASVPGSGWYHFVPLLPIVVDLLVRFVGRLDQAPRWYIGVVALFVVGFTVLMTPPFGRLNRAIDNRTWGADLRQDVTDAMADYPGQSIEMGYGQDIAKTYHYSFHKLLLVFAGHASSVDSMSEMEMGWRGYDMPQPRLDALAKCQTNVWLIPKGESPFALYNYFVAAPLFSDGYRAAFHRAYTKVDSLRLLDVWRCKADKSGS